MSHWFSTGWWHFEFSFDESEIITLYENKTMRIFRECQKLELYNYAQSLTKARFISTFSILHKFALEEIGTNWVYAIWLTEPPILCSVKVKASIFKASWYGLSCTTTKRRACPNKCQKSFGEKLDCIFCLCDKPKLSNYDCQTDTKDLRSLTESANRED